MTRKSTYDRQVKLFINTTLAVILGMFIFAAFTSWIEGLVAPGIRDPGAASLRPTMINEDGWEVHRDQIDGETRYRRETTESGRKGDLADSDPDQLDHRQ